jgi:hypothetical protein
LQKNKRQDQDLNDRSGNGNNSPQQVIEGAQLRWFGHVVRMGNDRMAWQAKTQANRPKGRPSNSLGKKGYRGFRRKEELNGMV